MTEQEWLRCDDPNRLYEFLRDATTPFKTRWQGWVEVPRFNNGKRKWGLVLCAWSRLLLHLLSIEEAHRLVDTAERFVEGEAERDVQAFQTLGDALGAAEKSGEHSDYHLEQAGISRLLVGMIDAIRHIQTAKHEGCRNLLQATAELSNLRARQAVLFRDVMGNPFQAPSFDPNWRSWAGGTVERIAQAIYDEKRFDNIPVLADALEEAGCDDAAILSHCREGGKHTLGCWVLDLVLNRS